MSSHKTNSATHKTTAADMSSAAVVAATATATISPSDRVEWSRTMILGFIEDYRRQRVLWDPNTKGYHIKQTKYEALKALGLKYGTEIRSIRSKIKSLRSSFHREHGKVINGRRKGIHYQPMWFAYEAIRFILDGETTAQQQQQQQHQHQHQQSQQQQQIKRQQQHGESGSGSGHEDDEEEEEAEEKFSNIGESIADDAGELMVDGAAYLLGSAITATSVEAMEQLAQDLKDESARLLHTTLATSAAAAAAAKSTTPYTTKAAAAATAAAAAAALMSTASSSSSTAASTATMTTTTSTPMTNACVAAAVDSSIVARVAAAVAAAAAASASAVSRRSADELNATRSDFEGGDFGNISADDVKTEIIESDAVDLVMNIRPRSATPSPASLNYYKPIEQQSSSISRKRKSTPMHNDECAPLPSKQQQQQHSNAHATRQQRAQSPASSSSNPKNGGTSQADEYGVFGEYVAITIRKLKTSKAKIVVKHLINNLLYEAELGKYDHGMPSSKEPPQLYKM